jgi:membrane protease YdiL (CAAX protease family)
VCFVLSTYVAWVFAALFQMLLIMPLIESVTQGIGFEELVSFEPTSVEGAAGALATLLRAVLGIALLAMMVPPGCAGLTQYLGPALPKFRLVLKYSVVVVVLVGAQSTVRALLGQPIVALTEIEGYKTLASLGFLLPYCVALAIGGPLYEEFLFRGFLFKGIAHSRMGNWAAVVITAAAWALIHTQFTKYQIVVTFFLGLYYGWVRLRTNSIWTPVFLHSLQNALFFVAAAIAVKVAT